MELFGRIVIDESLFTQLIFSNVNIEQRNINIDARRFRAIEPYIFSINRLRNGVTTKTSTSSNLAIYYKSFDDIIIPGTRRNPNIKLTLEFINGKFGIQEKNELVQDKNRDVSHNINIILRGDNKFVIGKDVTPNVLTAQNISGIVADTFLIDNVPIDGSIVRGTSVFGNSSFDLPPEVPPIIPNEYTLISEDFDEKTSGDNDKNISEQKSSSESLLASFCEQEISVTPIAESGKVMATCSGQTLAFVFSQPTDKGGNPIKITEDLLPELLTGDEFTNLDKNTSWNFWQPQDATGNVINLGWQQLITKNNTQQ